MKPAEQRGSGSLGITEPVIWTQPVPCLLPQSVSACSSVSQRVTIEGCEGLKGEWLPIRGSLPSDFPQSQHPTQNIVRPSVREMSQSQIFFPELCLPGSWVLDCLGEGVLHLALCAVEQSDFYHYKLCEVHGPGLGQTLSPPQAPAPVLFTHSSCRQHLRPLETK